MPKHILFYLLIVSLFKVGMVTHGCPTCLLLLLLLDFHFRFFSVNIGLWRHVHPIMCEWACLICIHKYIVGTDLTFYSRYMLRNVAGWLAGSVRNKQYCIKTA